ncbi:hypothetical protein GLOIN_2v1604326 [Rhizophagus clarus]|uniref:Uncharacterized protein n=1 Tax=Rhizophagus clarus TaxID=94130 RepID=A0A8H3QQ13_9GLOM|nr:hypothetical protein GLOIN_2v1604326 [Rhizophagus clarus]
MKYDRIFTIFQFICLIYFISLTVIASPISLPEFDPGDNEEATTTTTTSVPSPSPLPSSSPSAAMAVFTNPSNSSTAVTGQIKFTKISQNITNVNAGGLNEWSVNLTGTTPFQHDFDKLIFSKIIDQFFEISHHKKGTVKIPTNNKIEINESGSWC